MGNKNIINIGIGGATRSGKTTLAENLVKFLNASPNKLIGLDDYTDFDKVIEYGNNFEIPEVHDWKLFCKDLDNPKKIINYKGKNYILSEGFLLFKQPLCHKFEKSIFIYITKEICKERRMKTTRVPNSYFENILWPAYIKNNYHLAKWKKNKIDGLGNDLMVLDGTLLSKDEILNKSLNFIFGKNDYERDKDNEQKLLDKIEEEYLDLTENNKIKDK